MSGETNHITIRPANTEESKILATIHKNSIHRGFLSELPLRFLKLLYEFLITNEIVLVSELDNHLTGFITCSGNTKQMYKRFLQKHFLRATLILAPRLFSKNVFVKIIETLKTPFKHCNSSDNKINSMPELLSIAVIPEFREMGHSRLLLQQLEQELINRKIKQYHVIAGKELAAANRFYKKNNFVLESTVEIHKGSESNVYVKQLNATK